MKNQHLSRLQERRSSVDAQVQELLVGLTSTQRQWKPAPERWSVAECFEHLLVTGQLYYPPLRASLAKLDARGIAGDPAYRPSWLGGFFLKFLEPDSKKPLKAPKAFRPASSGGDPGIIESFLEQQGEFSGLIEAADGWDFNRTKFGSPISRVIRFTPGDGLTMMVTHQERHLGQAIRVTEAQGFPSE